MANVRSAYAEVSADGLTDPDKDHSATVTMTQKTEGWATNDSTKIAGVALKDIASKGDVVVKYTASTGKVTIGDKETTSNYSVTDGASNTNQNQNQSSGDQTTGWLINDIGLIFHNRRMSFLFSSPFNY